MIIKNGIQCTASSEAQHYQPDLPNPHSANARSGFVVITTIAMTKLTWYTADVHSSAVLEGTQALVDNVGLGVLPGSAVQGLFLSLQHAGQSGVRQPLHYDTLHQSAPVIILDVAYPLHQSRLREYIFSVRQAIKVMSTRACMRVSSPFPPGRQQKS